MNIHALILSCLLPLAAPAVAQEVGPKPVCKAGSRDFSDCARRLGDWQRRRDMLAKQARARNEDKEGRKFVYFHLKGILPEVEQKALEGDVIKGGLGVNNISINYKNSDVKGWTSFAGKIYTVQYDPATKKYSGWDKMEIRLGTTKTKEGPKKKKALIKVGSGVTFDKPLSVRICAETTLGNCFWTEFTAQVQGNVEEGFTIPGEFYLDHYSRTVGKDDAPLTAAPPPAGKPAAEEAKPAAEQAPKAAAAPAAPKPAAAPAAAAKPEPREVTASELMSKFKGLKMKSTNPADHGFAVRATVDLKVTGFAPSLKGQLAKDPVKVKKDSFKLKIYLKNTGESAWGNIKSQTIKNGYSDGDFTDFNLEMTIKENVRVSFDKPVTIRVEAESGAGLYWAETEGSKDSPPAAVVIDQYSPR